MNLTSVDWSRAQSLLMKLIQVLSPLAETEGPVFYCVDPKFFFKPTFSEESLKQPVQWLQTLQTVQKEVEQFVGPSTQTKPASTDPAPIKHQAKRLILEVQHAIGRLSNSCNLKEPKLEPLQEALVLIKSPLKTLVESVAKEEERGGEGLIDPNPTIVPFASFAKFNTLKKKKKKKKKD